MRIVRSPGATSSVSNISPRRPRKMMALRVFCAVSSFVSRCFWSTYTRSEPDLTLCSTASVRRAVRAAGDADASGDGEAEAVASGEAEAVTGKTAGADDGTDGP